MRSVDSAQRAKATIGCCRSAKAHDDSFGTAIERCINEFAGTRSGGSERVVALGAASQGETRGKRHLNDRGRAAEPPRRLYRIAERTGDHRGAIGTAEHIERAFTSVGHANLVAVVPKLPTRMANGAGDLGSGGCTAEFVDSSQNSHAARLPVAIQRDCVKSRPRR